MIWLVFVTCVLASALNAASTIAEREASKHPDVGELFSKQLSKTIIKNRKFLIGLGFQLFASILEVVALSQGSLVLIGPILTLDIVFLWIFIVYRYKRRVGIRNEISVVAVILSISLIYISTQPRDGNANYKGIPWIIAISLELILIFIAYVVTKLHESTNVRAAVLGVATAANYALDGALVKLLFSQIKHHNFWYIFINWPLYTLIGFAVISIVLTQNTYSAGSITISQPVIETVQAVVSILIGIFIFHDVIHHGALNLVGLILAAIVMSIGLVVIAHTENLYDEAKTVEHPDKKGVEVKALTD